jgi:hypothetical protein
MAPTLLAQRDPDAWMTRAIGHLAEYGFVLDSDPRLPSWPAMVVDEPIKGSWWSHPKAHLIFQIGARFIDHPDVLHVVLVSGKGTCVHRRLAPALLAVALSDETWKFAGLESDHEALLRHVSKVTRLFADEEGMPALDARRNGRLMRELERRLLYAGGSVHTARGSHAKYVTTWEVWMAEHRLRKPRIGAATGRQRLDQTLESLNQRFGGRGTLPWWPLRPAAPATSP